MNMTTVMQAGTDLSAAGLQPLSYRSHEASSSGSSDGAGLLRESSTVTNASLRVRLTIDPSMKSRGVNVGELCSLILFAALIGATVCFFGSVLIDLSLAIAQFNALDFVHRLPKTY